MSEDFLKAMKQLKGSKGKKNKKHVYMDMLDDFNLCNYQNEKESAIDTKKKMQNFQHLSNKEKESFFNKFSTPRNDSQRKFMSYLHNHQFKIIIASGPAGTGKTLFSIEQGIRNYLQGNVEKIIITRPSVSVDEDLGYLPGTLEEKMMPWVRPIYDVLYNFISPKEVEKLIEEKVFEICPLGFMRGRTFKHCWIIADEMQNSTIAQMKMLLTRIGENTRLIITGDLEQNDLKYELNGLEDFLNKIKGRRSQSINSVEFDKNDVERENVVREIIDIYRANEIPYSYREFEKEEKGSNVNNVFLNMSLSKNQNFDESYEMIDENKIEIENEEVDNEEALNEDRKM
jgi:phosphate starvation-inducible PhoH-like protein